MRNQARLKEQQKSVEKAKEKKILWKTDAPLNTYMFHDEYHLHLG